MNTQSNTAVKWLIGIAIAAFVIWISAVCVGVFWFVHNILPVWRGSERPMQTMGKVVVPSTPPNNSVVVFNFQPAGDPDAKLYAIGFARAFGDQLFCAPDGLVLEPEVNNLSDQIRCIRPDQRKLSMEDQARAIGKTMGVRYVITGDFHLDGCRFDITARIADISGNSTAAPVKLSGEISDLPSAQVKLVDNVIKAMKLNPDRAQSAFLSKANFSKPETLILYAQSFLAADVQTVKHYRWQMVKADPQALFPVMRLIELYFYCPLTYREVESDKEFQSVMRSVERDYAGVSQLQVLRGYLLSNQFEYRKAEDVLTAAVRSDPKSARAHRALSEIAVYRGNADLAVREAKEMAALWPTSAIAHYTLASAYNTAASSARHGHYYADMNRRMEREWYKSETAGLREALIAAKLDPNYIYPWYIILSASRELSIQDGVSTAFHKLTRLSPENFKAYKENAFTSSPQWGGTPEEQEKIFRAADKEFGAGSAEACLLRGQVMFCNKDNEKQYPEILRLANEAIRKSKAPNLQAMGLKCRVLALLGRRAEMLKIAKQGFEMYPSFGWRMHLAKGYQFRWEDAHDAAALNKAAELLSVYVSELPFDVYGHNQYGWCLSHLGRREEAKNEFLEALKLDPANKLAKEKLKYVQ